MTERTRGLLGQLAERHDDAFGKVIMVERRDDPVLTLRYIEPDHTTEQRASGTRTELEALGWRLLGQPPDVFTGGPRSCVRCRRLNFGPCISATCEDLQ